MTAQERIQVDLRQLKPNPMRDFTIDPIDLRLVSMLRASIHEHGFWGGIACRQLPDGTMEIVAGHHRVVAAMEEGMTTVDVCVLTDIDDAAMLRLAAREHGTAKGMTSATVVGIVASALRVVVKAAWTETVCAWMRTRDIKQVQRQLESGRGITPTVIAAFLHDVPGMTRRVIKQALDTLKASGHYARILDDVAQTICAASKEPHV